MKSSTLSHILLTIFVVTLAACAAKPALLPSPTLPASPTLQHSTSTPVIAPTLTIPVTPTSTVAPSSLPDVLATPMTLMLHPRNARFDSVAFLKEFISLLQQNDMQVLTYAKLGQQLDLAAARHEKLVIITIDDIYLRYPMHSSVLEMIDLLQKAGYPAVLGIVTESDYEYPETVTLLKELSDQGWEIASHSDTHRNLLDVEKIAPKSIYPEVKTSLDKIEQAIGIRPITLILPEGQMTNGDEQIKRTKVTWVVGINGGKSFNITKSYFYVGREGPTTDAATTFEAMKNRFAP